MLHQLHSIFHRAADIRIIINYGFEETIINIIKLNIRPSDMFRVVKVSFR